MAGSSCEGCLPRLDGFRRLWGLRGFATGPQRATAAFIGTTSSPPRASMRGARPTTPTKSEGPKAESSDEELDLSPRRLSTFRQASASTLQQPPAGLQDTAGSSGGRTPRMSTRSPHASGLGTPPQVLPENGQQAEGAAARPPRLSVRSPRKSGMGQAAEGGLQAEGTPGRFPRPSVLSPRKSTILWDAPVVSEPAGGASGESSDDDLVALSPARAPRASAMAPPRHSVAPQRMSMAPQRLSVAPSQRLSISPGKAANGQWGGPGGSGEPAGGRLTQLSPRLNQRASAMPAQRLSLRPAAATPAAEGSSDDEADDLLSRAAAAGASSTTISRSMCMCAMWQEPP